MKRSQSNIKAKVGPAVAVALLAGMPALAFAAGDSVIQSTSAQVSGLTYRLIDLDPNDGIAPSLTFGNSTLLINAYTFNNRMGFEDGQYGSIPLTDLTPASSSTVAFDGATTSVGPTGYSANVQTTLDLMLTKGEPYGWGFNPTTFNATINAYPDSANNMTLSANTLLVVTGSASISSQNNLQPLLDELNLLNPGQQAWAYVASESGASIVLSLDRQSLDGRQSTTDSSTFRLDSFGNVPGDAYDLSSPFTLQFANVGNTSADLTFTFGVGANNAILSGLDGVVVIDPPPSIPEPGTYMLMGLGLVGIGLTRRRT